MPARPPPASFSPSALDGGGPPAYTVSVIKPGAKTVVKQTADERTALLTEILNLGAVLLTGGAEVSRTEDTVSRMAAACGCSRSEVYVTPTLIVGTFIFADGFEYTASRRVNGAKGNLHQVEEANALSRHFCASPTSAGALHREVERIRELPLYPAAVNLAASVVMAAAFALVFGGTLRDALGAAVCGLAVWLAERALRRLGMKEMIRTLLCSAMTGVLAVLLVKAGIAYSADKTMIGTIMLMIPGLALVTALRDMINGDLTSGVTELLAALVRAMMIAVGIGLMLVWWKGRGFYDSAVIDVPPLAVRCAKLAVPCLLSALSWAVANEVKGGLKHAVLGAGALAGFELYLLVSAWTGSVSAGIIAGAFFVTACAELAARALKAPVIVLAVPMLIPLIPGGELFYTTVNWVQENTAEAYIHLRLVGAQAGGTALAILIEASLAAVIFKHRHSGT